MALNNSSLCKGACGIGLFLLALLSQCREVEPRGEERPQSDDTLRSLTITWDSTAKKISHPSYFAEYPRITRVMGDTLLLTYHFGEKTKEWDNVAVVQSTDNGNRWQLRHVFAPADSTYKGYCTPTLIRLQNKKILLY